MKSMINHILVATVPLLVLVTGVTLTEMFKDHHGRRTLKKLAAGALKGLSHGPQVR